MKESNQVVNRLNLPGMEEEKWMVMALMLRTSNTRPAVQSQGRQERERTMLTTLTVRLDKVKHPVSVEQR